MTFCFGVLVSYVLADSYFQSKTNLSVIQVLKLAALDKKHYKDQYAMEKNETTTYIININDVEHNFSFKGFSLDNLKIDGILMDTIKQKINNKGTL